MSIYEILPVLLLLLLVYSYQSTGWSLVFWYSLLDLTQSVHAKISIGMHRVVKFKISRIPLIGLETRLGWRTDRKFLQNPNLNEINIDSIFTLIVTMPCAPEQPHFLKLCCVICSFHSIRSRNCTVFSIMIFKFHQIFHLPESCDFLYAIDDSTKLPSTTIHTRVVSMSSFPYYY
jgi:hypothetical protein